MSDDPKPDPGVFVVRGMEIGIPSFQISLSPDGGITTDPVILHTGIDMCPLWLEVAFGHLLRTEEASQEMLRSRTESNNEAIGSSLMAESISGMQTIMASSIAMDAYYSRIRDCIDLPESLTHLWRTKGTARYKQIGEVLRRAFVLPASSAKLLRSALKECASFRDRAVHPRASTSLPDLHPELNKVTDWRFVAFRLYNAKAILGVTFSAIVQTAQKGRDSTFPAVTTYCADLLKRLSALIARWEARYGILAPYKVQ
jgi:hypothetical protein